MFAVDARAQHVPFSTHDWTVTTQTNPFNETWADVKTPGGRPRLDLSGGGLIADERRTYCVGTIEVETTGSGAEFSGRPASPDPIPAFSVINPPQQNRRQIVIVQCNQTERGTDGSGAADPNGIVWQRYFYGVTTDPITQDPVLTRATNARAIAVWEASDDENARVAICGETYDEVVPESQSPTGWTAASGTAASGYIAVYDGGGNLLWTHHFFAGSDPDQQCAITDLSIRVDAEGREIVTYCGIFTHGDPGSGTPLSPKLWFASPGTGASAGNTTQAGDEWDGFVGRLIRTGSTTTQVFHSIVGGPGQDGLFGLAEITADRFAVVGSTQAASGTSDMFPILIFGFGVLPTPYRVGAVLVFDASLTEITPTPGNLIRDAGEALGSLGDEVATHARDICIGHGVGIDIAERVAVVDMMYVVGSTSDPDFTPQSSAFLIPPTQGQDAFGGNTDGFLAVLEDVPTFPMIPWTWSYWGGEGYDGLTGVNCWNEFVDHVGVAGFTGAVASAEIGVSTFFFDNAYGPAVPGSSTALPSNSRELFAIRDALVAGANDERPAVMGGFNATDVVAGTFTGGAYDTFGLGQSSGGGVAVGNDGRINAVGRTAVGGGYPVLGSGRASDLGFDAVRTELDMVPRPVATSLPGVGRTDGTGRQGPGSAPTNPVFPIAGYTGGTTPDCALRPFGLRIGEAAPPVQRMLIDYEGGSPDLGVDNAAILVSRPPIVPGSVSAGVIWIGFPPTTGPNLYVDGTECWADPSTWVLLLDLWPGNRPYRMPLGAFPTSGSATLSVQLLCLLDPTPGSGYFGFTPTTFGTGCASEFVASPALWFSF